ncbi:MAG: phosphotransferase, partial [Coriobacteriia bacterium]|nr:phosphotransferase [Coriobacteriia bacterium]
VENQNDDLIIADISIGTEHNGLIENWYYYSIVTESFRKEGPMPNNEQPEALEARGRSAEIIPYQDGKVVKLFLKGFPAFMIEAELANTIEAHAQGATSMQCYGTVEMDGRTGIVLDWVKGEPMTKAAEKNPMILLKSGQMLADQHVLVHSKTSERLRDVRELAVEFLDDESLAVLSIDEREKAKRYIARLPEGNTILHLDFHTENVMVDGTDCVTIDWLTAARGYPEVEIGVMDYVFHYGLLFPGISKLQEIFYTTVRSFVYNGYLKNYLKATGVDLANVDRWRLISLIIRRRIWAHEFEKDTLTEQMKACIARIED